MKRRRNAPISPADMRALKRVWSSHRGKGNMKGCPKGGKRRNPKRWRTSRRRGARYLASPYSLDATTWAEAKRRSRKRKGPAKGRVYRVNPKRYSRQKHKGKKYGSAKARYKAKTESALHCGMRSVAKSRRYRSHCRSSLKWHGKWSAAHEHRSNPKRKTRRYHIEARYARFGSRDEIIGWSTSRYPQRYKSLSRAQKAAGRREQDHDYQVSARTTGTKKRKRLMPKRWRLKQEREDRRWNREAPPF